MNEFRMTAGRQALDRIEIEETVRHFGRGMDGRMPDDDRHFHLCFTDDVEVVYQAQGIGTWRGIEAHKRIDKVLTKKVFTWTQHMFMNALIDLNGDEADAEYYVFAAHFFDGKVVYAGCIYRQKLLRTPAGWRISRHECVSNWTDDAGGVAKAMIKAMPKL